MQPATRRLPGIQPLDMADWLVMDEAFGPQMALRDRLLKDRREEVFATMGGEEAAAEPRFKTSQGRVEHMEEVDGMVGAWIAERDLDEVLRAFEEAEAAIGPAYDIAQIYADPQYQARGDIVTVDDDELGPMRMANAFPYLSETPGTVRHAGPAKGAHNNEIYGSLGLGEAELEALRADGVI